MFIDISFIVTMYIYLISPGHISSLEDNVFDCTVVNDMLLPENIDAKKLFHVFQMNLEKRQKTKCTHAYVSIFDYQRKIG